MSDTQVVVSNMSRRIVQIYTTEATDYHEALRRAREEAPPETWTIHEEWVYREDPEWEYGFIFHRWEE